MLTITNTSHADEQIQQKTHSLGAGSCASSNCHGGSKANLAYQILGNEYTIWKKKDSHSRAWETLTNNDSKIISINLGIDSPSTDQRCLSCHSGLTSTENQDEIGTTSFKVETEGVTCESCHGVATNWIKSHTVKDTPHAENLKNGMNNLVDPIERSKVCLDCHIGDSSNEVTHQLISAGHPRLTFELDTFSQITPPHWKIDQDYIERKGEVKTIQYWLAGQIKRSLKLLENYGNSLKFNRQPDFAYGYCYSCHHNLSDNQWKKRNYHGKTGLIKLNLSSILLTKVAMKGLDITVYQELESIISKLENIAYTEVNPDDIQRLMVILETKVKPKITAISFDKAKLLTLRNEIIQFGKSQKYPRYEIAEQIIMALSSVADSLGENAVIKYKKFYDLLKDEKNFNEGRFASQFEKL